MEKIAFYYVILVSRYNITIINKNYKLKYIIPICVNDILF